MKTIIASCVIACAAFISSAQAECNVQPVEGSADFKVSSKDGNYQGYVSPNADGSWFAWVKGVGAVNQKFTEKAEAIAFVCMNNADS